MKHLNPQKVWLLLAFLCTALLGHAQTRTDNYTSGTTWTVPTGVNSITIRVWGGGGGTGGQDCGLGCSNASPGHVGYVEAVYSVTPGTSIGIYPGGRGADGANNTSGAGGGSGGSSSYSVSYNGGRGGNAGSVGGSGGGGGGGAASLVLIGGTIRIVAGGAGGGGGMANQAGSGRNGYNSHSANGTSTAGATGRTPSGDGGGSGGGGGGNFGGAAGALLTAGAEQAGDGGYRGNNSVTGASSVVSNSTTTRTSAGQVTIVYTPVGGTASSDQTICSGSQPANISLSGYAGTIQWQVSTNNSTFTNISGATGETLTSAQMGTLTAIRYYRAFVSGTVYSNTVTVSVQTAPTAPTSISGAGTICSGQSLVLTAAGGSEGSGSSYQWGTGSTVGDNIIVGQTSSSISVSPVTNTTYWVRRVGNTTCTNTTSGVTANVTVNAAPEASAPSGSGTEGDPYLISNFAQLKWVSENSSSWSGHFRVTQAIDASATAGSCYLSNTGWSPIGNSSTPFTGSFTANSPTSITGLRINRNTSDYQGLFGNNTGTIRNIQLISASVTGKRYVGALAGSNSGTIENCSSAGTVVGSNMSGRVGGLVGNMSAGAIRYSFSLANVSNDEGSIGGFVGDLSGGIIHHSYARGNVSKSSTYNNSEGGFIGQHFGGEVRFCYSTGSLPNGGGFIGVQLPIPMGSGTDENCFWNTTTSGRATSSGSATGIATAAMQSWTTFLQAGFDMRCERLNGNGDYWGKNSSDNNAFPFLAWQSFTASCPEWTGTSNNSFGTSTNWVNNFVPLEGMDIIISPTATNHLPLPASWIVGDVVFQGADRRVQLGNHNLTILGAVTGANTTNYIQTDGTGKLVKTIASGASFSFPVGGNHFNTLTLTNRTGVADVFSVRVFDEVRTAGLSGISSNSPGINCTWDISKQSPNAGDGVDFEFNWQNAQSIGTYSNLNVYHYDGFWQKLNGTTNVAANSLVYTGYGGTFSPFAVTAPSGILPVEGWKVYTKPVAGAVEISWSTQREYNTSHFTVEHSLDGRVWTALGSERARGNSTLPQSYSFLHQQPKTGRNFYRIQQVDIDGKFVYSPIQTVQFNPAAVPLKVFPNPVTAQLQVVLPNAGEWRLINGMGQQVKSNKAGAGQHSIDMSNLPAGVYYFSFDQQIIKVNKF